MEGGIGRSMINQAISPSVSGGLEAWSIVYATMEDTAVVA